MRDLHLIEDPEVVETPLRLEHLALPERLVDAQRQLPVDDAPARVLIAHHDDPLNLFLRTWLDAILNINFVVRRGGRWTPGNGSVVASLIGEIVQNRVLVGPSPLRRVRLTGVGEQEGLDALDS